MSDDEQKDYGPPEYGVRSSNIGSFIPEGTYRPVPIVWLAGAGFLQIPALMILFLVFSASPPIFTVLSAGLVSLAIGRWTFRRGMAQASSGWRIFTMVVLGANWALVSFGAFALSAS